MELVNYILQTAGIDPSLFLKVAPIVALTLSIMSGISIILNAVAKYTKGQGDDKAAGLFDKIIDGLKKLNDILMGNPKH